MKTLRPFGQFLVVLVLASPVSACAGLIVLWFQSSRMKAGEYVHAHRYSLKPSGERQLYYLTDSQESWHTAFEGMLWGSLAVLVLMVLCYGWALKQNGRAQ